ncbi:MAG: hypothetical protein RQ751_04185 [Longimicrobiales bacterium]|nr:hypothetical protein [Longimicrobiales bacterium]
MTSVSYPSRRAPGARLRTAALAACALLPAAGLLPAPASAQEPDSARLAELERRMEALTREIERLSLGEEVVQADTSIGGLGFGASKVYAVQQGVSIGGYGELLYENFSSEREDGVASGRRNQFDALRAILYVGYKFNDRLLFNSEIEIEHADEIFLEFAYLDYLITPRVGLRGGMLLAPLGLVNELHEPSTFLGTKRTVTESRIIPSTWRENGVGLFGEAGDVDWRVYLMTSLDGSGFNAGGLRGGRQKGSRSVAEDVGVAARLDFKGYPGLTLGASGYLGQTAQGQELNGAEVGGDLFIWDLHADYKARGWELRALVAGATLDDVSELNALNGLTGSGGIGDSMLGWYVQAGYDVLRGTRSTHQLVPYLTYEEVDTQRGVATGFTADPANDLRVASLGLAWRPVPQVVWKADYQFHSNEADTGVDQLNVQIGWLF